MTEEQNQLVKPKYIDLLEPADVIKYNTLRQTLSSNVCRYNRGSRLVTFQEMLSAIKAFCIRNEADDWKRCIVCGICWLPNGIAVNNRQFSLLIDKCKSSINGSFQRMGYGTVQSRQDAQKMLTTAIPFLDGKYTEIREWSVRQFAAVTPQPHLTLLPNKVIKQKFSPMPQMLQPNNAISPVGTKLDYNSYIPYETGPIYGDTGDMQEENGDQQNPYDEYDPFSLEPSFLYE